MHICVGIYGRVDMNQIIAWKSDYVESSQLDNPARKLKGETSLATAGINGLNEIHSALCINW